MKFASQQAFFDFIKTLRFIASKELGQNFLVNEYIAENIVAKAKIHKDDRVLEIGAGFGSLSYFISLGEGEITLLDVDPKVISFLNDQFGQKTNVKIVQESILKHDISQYHKIIGNLPYYITSDTIQYCLLNARQAKTMIFMIQKEVLPRLIARFGEDGYGPLALLLSFLGKTKRVFNVAKNNFVPAPKVDSVVVEIVLHENNDYETAEKLVKITNSLFHHRRKTVRNNLRIYLDDIEKADKVLSELGVDGSKRPEELNLDFYLTLIKQLKF